MHTSAESKPVKIKVKGVNENTPTKSYFEKVIDTSTSSPDNYKNIKTMPNTTKNKSLQLLKSNEPVSILSLLGSQNYVPLHINNLNENFEKNSQPKISTKTMSEIKAYAANTNQGIVR